MSQGQDSSLKQRLALPAPSTRLPRLWALAPNLRLRPHLQAGSLGRKNLNGTGIQHRTSVTQAPRCQGPRTVVTQGHLGQAKEPFRGHLTASPVAFRHFFCSSCRHRRTSLGRPHFSQVFFHENPQSSKLLPGVERGAVPAARAC